MQFTFAGFQHMPLDGYGYATLKIAETLRRDWENAQILDLGQPVWDAAQVYHLEQATVALCTPDWLPLLETAGQPLVSYTMFEATRLPAGWVEKLNACAALVLVPCQWCKTIFEANGVTRPIAVVKWGIDSQDYYPLERARDGQPYTFLWSGTPDKRKGWALVYTAFRQAFGDRDDVRLVLHFRQLPPGLHGCQDRNVTLIAGLLERPALRDMLRAADCFVFPSRGEGWGLPPREAAATGLPVIVTDYGGLAEDVAQWAVALPTTGMSPAEYGPAEWGDIGYWAEPDGRWLAEWLRWSAAHPRDMAELGRRAADFMARQSWAQTAAGMVEALQCKCVL